MSTAGSCAARMALPASIGYLPDRWGDPAAKPESACGLPRYQNWRTGVVRATDGAGGSEVDSEREVL